MAKAINTINLLSERPTPSLRCLNKKLSSLLQILFVGSTPTSTVNISLL